MAQNRMAKPDRLGMMVWLTPAMIDGAAGGLSTLVSRYDFEAP